MPDQSSKGRLNLDALKAEIQEHLEHEGFSIFHGYSRMMDTQSLVFWDTDRHPEYRLFVKVAKAAGAPIMVLNQRNFKVEIIDDAIERLELSDLPVEEQRAIERRLKELRVYDGFTCSIELSFDYGGRVYLFDLQTEWYNEFSSLLEELEFFDSDDDDDEDEEDAIGGYFSKN